MKTRVLFVLAVLLLQAAPTALVASAQATPIVSAPERDRGIELYRQGKYKDASDLLKKAVKKNKADDQAWYYLGLALVHQPKPKNAAKAFETVLKLQPDSAPARVGLGYVHLLNNKSASAIFEAQAALRIDPSIADAHYILGAAYLNSGTADDALREAKEAIQLNPQLTFAYLLKSRALVGIYAKRAMDQRRVVPAASSSSLTPEQRSERSKKRAEEAALFDEAATDLQTYLKLNPSDSSGAVWREQLNTLKVFAKYGSDDSDEAIFSGDQVTTKVRVLAKPEPSYTEPARRAQVVGTVVLRAVFAADGTIRHVLILNRLPNGLTEQALRAARKIKFVPATKDGRPVSMVLQLEYNFNLY